MGSGHHKHQLCLPSSSRVQRKLTRDLPAACKIRLPHQLANTAAVICGCWLQFVYSELLKKNTHEILLNYLLLLGYHDIVCLQKMGTEVEAYREHINLQLTVPQTWESFSRLDSTARHFTDKFKGPKNPLSTAIYDKTFTTPNNKKNPLSSSIQLWETNKGFFPCPVERQQECSTNTNQLLLKVGDPSDADCQSFFYRAISQQELGKASRPIPLPNSCYTNSFIP